MFVLVWNSNSQWQAGKRNRNRKCTAENGKEECAPLCVYWLHHSDSDTRLATSLSVQFSLSKACRCTEVQRSDAAIVWLPFQREHRSLDTCVNRWWQQLPDLSDEVLELAPQSNQKWRWSYFPCSCRVFESWCTWTAGAVPQRQRACRL